MNTTHHSRFGRIRAWGQFVGATAAILFATMLVLTAFWPTVQSVAGETASTVVLLSFGGALFIARGVGMRLGLFETWLGI